MASKPSWAERTIETAGVKLYLKRAGKGSPLVVLHHDFGTPDQAELYDQLAASHDVIVPHHAGWGKSKRPEWMRSVRDQGVDAETRPADVDGWDVVKWDMTERQAVAASPDDPTPRIPCGANRGASGTADRSVQ